MAFQKMCPSCNKYASINTIDGNSAEYVRCDHCGFMMHIPPKKYSLKGYEFGDLSHFYFYLLIYIIIQSKYSKKP